MHIQLKHVAPLGYVGSSIFSGAQNQWVYYKTIARTRCVILLSNYCPKNISFFRLSPGQFTKFKRGKLSLVPPYCCNPAGGPKLDKPNVFYEGEFSAVKQVRALLEYLEKVLNQEIPSLEAKLVWFRASGWTPINPLQVWMLKNGPDAASTSYQIILPNGRVIRAEANGRFDEWVEI